MKKHHCIGKLNNHCWFTVSLELLFLLRRISVLLVIVVLSQMDVKAQYSYNPKNEIAVFSYDDLLVKVIVDGYGTFYVNAIYTNRDSLYIDVKDLFTTLNIPCIASQGGDSLEGFIDNESRTYLIDFDKKQIEVGSKTINAYNGIVKEMNIIFLESSLFVHAFGIELNFNFRSLAMELNSDFELPFIKQERLEEMRSNIVKLQGEKIADTVIKRDYHLFKLGVFDWTAGSFQIKNGPIQNSLRIGVGTELLFGEADVSIYYNNLYKYDKRDLNYLWRWVDNDKSIIKQAQVGKISTQTIAFINAPIVGAVVRNAPTTVRKATGYYNISEITEPNWTVELYINNVLVNYTKTDASGLYTFKVPIVYGYTTLKLKFYGPMGEERIEERTLNVPYSILPTNEFEYSLTAGILQDGHQSTFAKAELNYGVSRMLTVGGGMEYLSSIPNGPFIPFAKVTFQPFGKLTLNAEYDHGVKTRCLINYNFWQNALLEIDFSKFVKGELATLYNTLEERRIKLSLPFNFKRIIVHAKFDFSQFVYSDYKYNRTNVTFSANYKNLSVNSSTFLNWTEFANRYVNTNLALSYRLKKGLVIRPSVMYDVSNSKFSTYNVTIEKRISKAYLSASYERNLSSNANFIYLSYKLNLSFATININTNHFNGKYSVSENVNGSLAFGSGNNYIYGSKNSSVGKGGISLYPFLDLNNNGKFDKGERMVKINSVRVYGGRPVFSKKDSIIRIPDLNPFISYTVVFSDYDLESIAWQFTNKTYQILVDPNQFKRVDVPIISVGEVSGMIYMNNHNNLDGIGRVTIQIWDKNGKKVAETLSERDGYYSYLGLSPNDYVVRIDEEQLKILDFQSTPLKHNAVITQSVDGDFLDGLDFVLKSKEKRTEDSLVQQNIINSSKNEDASDKTEFTKIVNKPVFNLLPSKDSIAATILREKKNVSDSVSKSNISQKTTKKSVPIKPVPGKNISANKTKTNSNINTSFGNISDINGLFYSVQIGIYKNYVTAKQLKNLTPIFYETLPNGNNRYFSGKYYSEEETEKAKKVIIAKGVKDAFVVTISKGVRLVATTSQSDKTEFSKIVNKPVFKLPPSKDSVAATTLPEKMSLNDSISKNISANKTKANSNINTSFGNISDINGLFYSVQIGVYKNYVTAKQLKNLTPIFYETLPNGNNRYFSSKYYSEEKAKKAKNVIITKGIKDAFVVTISKGVRLVATTSQSDKTEFSKIVNKPVFNLPPTKDSLEATTLPEKMSLNDSISENNSANKTKTNSNINTSFGNISDINGLFYSVQIGVYKNYVTAKQLKNLTPIFYETLPNGNNRYFSGKYYSEDEAEKAKIVIIAKGIKDAFVVTISKGVRLAAITGNQNSVSIKVIDEKIVDESDLIINRINN
jgi:hypothetical protein